MLKTAECVGSAIPNTLILPDGNRRWATENNVPYTKAYEIGARRIVECAHYLGTLGLSEVWFGVARPFNFERTASEVTAVLDACLQIQEIGRENGDPFNITVGGDSSLMPPKYQHDFKTQESDYDPSGVTAHLLIGWSSETEVASFARRVQGSPQEPLNEQLLRSSAVTTPVDFLIRTGIHTPNGQGGRVSGMLPLHSLEAELHFEPTLFPDFTTAHLDRAIIDYQTRTHRNKISLTD